jgi:hypothetical protein
MTNEFTKKPSKTLQILFWVICIALVVPGICIVIAFFHSKLSRNENDPRKIENKTGLIQACGRSLYDASGRKIRLEGVNDGNMLETEGWMSTLALKEDKDKNGKPIMDEEGRLTYVRFGQEQLLRGLKENPNLKEGEAEEYLEYFASCWWQEEDFRRVKGLGLNAIRLPFYWRFILSGDYSPKPAAQAFRILDSFLEGAKRNGLYVILDLHGAPESQNGYEHSGEETFRAGLWEDPAAQEAVVGLWKAVSEHYTGERKDLSGTIAAYDVLNEPASRCGGFSDKTVWKFYDRIYKALRVAGDNHVIAFEGIWDFTRLPDPRKYGWKNVLYEYHWYNFAYRFVSYRLFYLFQEFTSMLKGFDVPVYIGEFNCFSMYGELKKQLEYFAKKKYSWTFWAYKSNSTGTKASHWALYTCAMDLKNNETKTFVSSSDLVKLKQAAEMTKTENCISGSVLQIIQGEMIREEETMGLNDFRQ